MIEAAMIWKILMIALFGFSLMVVYALLRNKATPLSSIQDFEERIASGKPTFLRFFKNT